MVNLEGYNLSLGPQRVVILEGVVTLEGFELVINV